MRRRFGSVLLQVVTTVFVVAAATPGWAANVQVTDGDT